MKTCKGCGLTIENWLQFCCAGCYEAQQVHPYRVASHSPGCVFWKKGDKKHEHIFEEFILQYQCVGEVKVTVDKARGTLLVEYDTIIHDHQQDVS